MTELSLLELKSTLTPLQFARYFKNKGPLYFKEMEKLWIVSNHSLAKQILLNPQFSCDRTAVFTANLESGNAKLMMDFLSLVTNMMVMSDAPKHTLRRRICYEGFGSQVIHEWSDLARQYIQTQINLCKNKNSLELVEEIAIKIPMEIFANFFNIPETLREEFYLISNTMTQFFGGSIINDPVNLKKVNAGAKALKSFFTELLEMKRQSPSDDFLSSLIKHQNSFELTDDEILAQTVMILLAGQVTTTDQFSNNMYTLLSNPDVFSILQNNMHAAHFSMENVIEELNRLDPAVTFIFRIAKEDYLFEEQQIRAGDPVFIATHAVNRDDSVFQQPDLCNFFRESNPHFSYGFGSHYCFGAKFANKIMRVCLEEMLNAFPNLRLNEALPPIRKHESIAFSGFSQMSLLLG